MYTLNCEPAPLTGNKTPRELKAKTQARLLLEEFCSQLFHDVDLRTEINFDKIESHYNQRRNERTSTFRRRFVSLLQERQQKKGEEHAFY